MDDQELAIDLATRAGALLQDHRVAAATDSVGVDPRLAATELRNSADAAAQAFLSDCLTRERPGDAVLSEEAVDSSDRDHAQRVWIIDPLDGTWEYGTGRHDWAVHVALWTRDAAGSSQLALGAVAIPDDDVTYASFPPPTLPPLSLDRPLRIIASRSRPPKTLAAVAAALESAWESLGGPRAAEILSVGSVGAKVGRILRGDADIYLHDSGFYEWDVAAPLAVAQAAGLLGSHLDGTALTFNHRPPYVTDLAIARPELAGALAEVLAEHRAP